MCVMSVGRRNYDCGPSVSLPTVTHCRETMLVCYKGNTYYLGFKFNAALKKLWQWSIKTSEEGQ